jgi:hypothetical protein
MTREDGATSDAQKRFDTSLVILFRKRIVNPVVVGRVHS